MTDTDRINALEEFAAGMVWMRNQVRDRELLSSIAMPVRPVGKAYAEHFQVPHWNSLREAIDAWQRES